MSFWKRFKISITEEFTQVNASIIQENQLGNNVLSQIFNQICATESSTTLINWAVYAYRVFFSWDIPKGKGDEVSTACEQTTLFTGRDGKQTHREVMGMYKTWKKMK